MVWKIICSQGLTTVHRQKKDLEWCGFWIIWYKLVTQTPKMPACHSSYTTSIAILTTSVLITKNNEMQLYNLFIMLKYILFGITGKVHIAISKNTGLKAISFFFKSYRFHMASIWQCSLLNHDCHSCVTVNMQHHFCHLPKYTQHNSRQREKQTQQHVQWMQTKAWFASVSINAMPHQLQKDFLKIWTIQLDIFLLTFISDFAKTQWK